MAIRGSFLAAVVASLLACGGAENESALSLVLPGGAATQAALSVVWSIQEASGCGTIGSSTGSYLAPAVETTCHVVATVAGTAVSGVATVAVTAAATPPPAPPPPAPPPPASSGDSISRCASDPIRSTGTVYYFCNCDAGAAGGCVAGDDANPGTSPSAPRRSFGAAQSAFRTMNAGDTVALCRGGRWNSVSSTAPHWVNSRCRAGTTCDLRAYDPPGTSGRARPYLDFTGTALDFWSAGGTAGYRFQGIAFHGRLNDSKGFFGGTKAVSDVLLCDNEFDNFTGAAQLTSDRVHFVSNVVTNSGANAYLGASNYGRVENNVFDNNGLSMFDHSIYLATNVEANGGTGMIVRGNRSTRAAGRSGSCGGVHIVVHGQFTNLLIENNVVEEADGFAQATCWGIGVGRDSEVPSGTINPEYFRNVTIRGNTVRNIGNVYFQIDQCENCVLENNLIVGNPSIGARGIRVGATVPQSGTNGTDTDVRAVIVRNNTVYLTAADSDGIMFSRAGGGGHEVYNNAVYSVAGRCDTEAGVAYSSNNACTTSANAAWFNAAGKDFVPGATSPLLDAGTLRSGQAPTTDLTGRTRTGAPDIGAFERP